MSGGLTFPQLLSGNQSAALQNLQSRTGTLSAAQAAFATQFAAAYPGVLASMITLAQACAALEAQRVALNADITSYNNSLNLASTAPATGLPVLPAVVQPMEAVSLDRTCLPAAGLTPAQRYGTPMAIQGSFFVPGRIDGLPASVSQMLQQQEQARLAELAQMYGNV
jgi:hypothetical protein